MSGDAYHITAPSTDGDGGYRAMKAALEDSKLSKNQIDYINAHGTSTPSGDKVEVLAIERMFDDRKRKINVSSTKSQIGHLLGAAGGVEAAYSILCINNKKLPYTLNLENAFNSKKINFIKEKAIDFDINYKNSESSTTSSANDFQSYGTTLLFKTPLFYKSSNKFTILSLNNEYQALVEDEKEANRVVKLQVLSKFNDYKNSSLNISLAPSNLNNS